MTTATEPTPAGTLPREAERRAFRKVELRTDNDKPVIIGYASVFNSPSVDMGFIEYVKPGAFKRSLANGADVRALVGHNDTMILGRNTAGTLKLAEDNIGLRVEIFPPDTSVGRDTVESIRRGDLDGMSIGFYVIGEEWDWSDPEKPARRITEADLFDVSVVTYPAYPDTAVAVRSLQQAQKINDEQRRVAQSAAVHSTYIASARIRLERARMR